MNQMFQSKDTEWLNEYKNKIHMYATYRGFTSDLKTHTHWKWGDGKSINGKSKENHDSNLISDEIDFKMKTVTRDKERHYKMISGAIQEDISIVNIYAPNKGAPKHIKQILTDIKAESDSKTIMVENFNTPLTSVDRWSSEKILALNDIRPDVLNRYRERTFHAKAAKHTFASRAHGTFSGTDHMSGHKTGINKFKRIEIISRISSDHNIMRTDINYKKKTS